MSTVKRDLWPEDIKAEDVIAPAEILEYQAEQLVQRTNGLLSGHVERTESEDRVVMGFEVEVARSSDRVRLFEVQHRLDYEYPAAILPPHDERLPDFLQERVYKPGAGSILRTQSNILSKVLGSEGEWVKNEWLATSPSEFIEKVERVLALPGVKAVVLSLLARASRPDNGPKKAE